MKLTHFLMMGILLLFAACGDSAALRQENELLREKAKNDSMYISSLNDEMDIVYNNLDSVKLLIDSLTQSTDLLKTQKTGKKETAELIGKGMTNVDSLLEYNRVRIAQLEEKLNKADKQTAYFKKMVNRLNKELAEREQMIISLNRQLASMGQEVEGLKAENRKAREKVAITEAKVSEAEKKAALAEEDARNKTRLLNTGYYLVGTKKELSTQGIIKVQGVWRKITGIGEKLDEDKFTKLSIQQDQLIELGNDKIKENNIHLVPERVPGHYTFSKANGRTYLNISHPQEFWKISKYLVVAIE